MTRTIGIHCSYHKCLTGLTSKVFRTLWKPVPKSMRRYRHFNSDLERFRVGFRDCTVASVNNHVIPLDLTGETRISRFVRDPRDLVVSGYFYHRRGAEAWCRQPSPDAGSWSIVNGSIPKALLPGESFAECLTRLEKEEGLLAEIDFRARHFESMSQWPIDPAHILVQRYEDIVLDTPLAFVRIARHFGLSGLESAAIRQVASYYSSGRVMSRSSHVRNPSPSQWTDHFTPRVESYFMDRWRDLIVRYGYPSR